MKFISVVTPCYNEEHNVEDVYIQVKEIFQKLKDYKYEHIFIDNASTDKTVSILKKFAKEDKNLKIIVNMKNFGHVRSPYHAYLQGSGDAVISLAADLQNPPYMIENFIRKWEDGSKIVIGIKNGSKDNTIMFWIRKLYYNLVHLIAETEHIKNFDGFGLYDKSFINILKKLNEPYPYFRGLVAELGFDRCEIQYKQPERKKGKTKNKFYTLYDIAMLGFINHSKVPLRLASFIGFITAFLSLLVAVVYFVYKIFYWKEFSIGIAPLVIGLFFFGAVQLFFIGIIGEYVGAIYTQTKNRPLVIEKERVNFDGPNI